MNIQITLLDYFNTNPRDKHDEKSTSNSNELVDTPHETQTLG